VTRLSNFSIGIARPLRLVSPAERQSSN
jgi:hypothetical protein